MTTEPDDMTVSDSQRLIARNHAKQTRRWVKAVALLLAAVAAGVVIGVGGTILFFDKKMHRVPPKPDAIVDAMVNRIRELTNATDDEAARMKEVLDQHMDEIDEMRRKYFADTRRMFENMDTEVDAIIGVERGKIWREYKKKRSEEWHRERDARRGGRSKPPGGKTPPFHP